jgi:hypothetical protein
VWDEMWDVGGNVDLSLKVQGLSKPDPTWN